ncbi:MAG: hemolysin III family protein [Alphaproteobacteria bacterium]|nr:hemolysin III family protein [Alphaproteobacteria bacterium]MBU6473644.1 hemolysin III family protein [Alphaproteobacteria bacterium]MDE2011418.1 hemolysin III family protein [Alphaproteobacteria bacterium]MDE2071809.1 hemolysin III family protein [Alphaproteobacteria bacterium]MDE2350415.1 hemolysin III family protein [Alphaproteobacteria bacterium]
MHIWSRPVRLYSRPERWADGAVHVLGILFAINASLWLLANVTGLSVVVSVSVYCVGLLAMTGFSAAYNLMPHHRPSKQVLRRLDHAAIFIMIAATYTPLAVNRLGPVTGDWLLAAIWITATIGVVMKLVFPQRFENLSIAFYLGMGWMVVMVLKPLAASMATADFWLLIAGGLVYSAGVIFYVWDRMPFHKAIWHGFVLIAAVLQYSAVAAEFAH